jgi:hypothetical protein
MRLSIQGALLIGLRLMTLHRETADDDTPGGFRAAIGAISEIVPRTTAYRWINAAAVVIARHQGIMDDEENFEADDIKLPAAGTPDWLKLETMLTEHSQGMSIRRLLIGSIEKSEESRYDKLLTRDEEGDANATALLEQVAVGQLTLVQAIRALGGMKQKEKTRTDPVYLDLDGRTGQPTGLFPKCLITIANTFSRWHQLDESARIEVKKSWKAVVANLPKELR